MDAVHEDIGVGIRVVDDGLSCVDIIEQSLKAVGREEKDDAFYVVDLGDILLKHKKWVSQLPRVEPFYAMKCNNDPNVLKLLATLGIGFDCASKVEYGVFLLLHSPV
ncbi:PREDICTED: ornithine decarboxylase-like [Acropora digitifera]|uniref:ornithine decarboxylase-like n=1 Tax=Acropora digitifera TaxID=70779 RepID=UPI00077A5E88|nr:PREDICTED: ornithine decarboxylase-like [Acropora digitifera]